MFPLGRYWQSTKGQVKLFQGTHAHMAKLTFGRDRASEENPGWQTMRLWEFGKGALHPIVLNQKDGGDIGML